MKKLVKNGMLCTESGVYEADLLIEGGVIREIGTGLSDAEAEVVEAKGKYVLPGAVDIHTHMDLDVGIARVIDDCGCLRRHYLHCGSYGLWTEGLQPVAPG